MSGMAQAFEPVTPPRVYYFGCGRRVGHWWHAANPDGEQAQWSSSSAIASAMRTVFPDIDATFAPGGKTFVEGEAKLSQLRGWTVLAWWDNSVDHRPNSNSAIVADRLLEFDQMVALLAIHFPEVSKRQRVPIKFVELEVGAQMGARS